MSNFTVLRMQKIKSRAGLTRSLKHAYREQETPNADSSKLPENTHQYSSSVKESMQKFTERINTLERKVRKDAVVAIEYLVTGSPEKMHSLNRGQQDDYFRSALKYFEEKHGKENMLAVTVHRDETTPHMSIYVVPITKEQKLSCKSFYGERGALNKLQTDFTQRVALEHGFKRGVEGSKAKHVSIQEYYARVNQSEKQLKNDKPKLLESKEEYGRRLLKTHGSYRDKLRETLNKTNNLEKILDSTQRDLQHKNKVIEETKKALNLKFLNDEDKAKLRKVAYKMAVERVEKDKTQDLKKKKEPTKSRQKNLGKSR